VVPSIRALLAQLHAEVDALEAAVEPTWESLAPPLERIVDRLSRAWGTVSHLKAVKDSEELRKAVEEVQPERVKLSLRLSQVRNFPERAVHCLLCSVHPAQLVCRLGWVCCNATLSHRSPYFSHNP
jgi:Zn-dependent oligopeptidase